MTPRRLALPVLLLLPLRLWAAEVRSDAGAPAPAPTVNTKTQVPALPTVVLPVGSALNGNAAVTNLPQTATPPPLPASQIPTAPQGDAPLQTAAPPGTVPAKTAGTSETGPPASIPAEPGGGRGHKAVEHAKSEAKKFVSPPPQEVAAPSAEEQVGVRLRDLNGRGFTVLPPFAVMGEGADRKVLEVIDREYARPGAPVPHQFLELSHSPTINSNGKTIWDDERHGELNAVLRPFAQRLTGHLNRALGENVSVRDTQIRITTKENPDKPFIHVDGGAYFTLTYAFRGPGTDIFVTRPDGTVETIRGPPHTAGLITTRDRELMTGIEGTVHSAPAQTADQRVLLIIRFYRPGTPELSREEAGRLDDKLKGRAAKVTRVLERQERARSGQPKPKGLLDSLKGLFR